MIRFILILFLHEIIKVSFAYNFHVRDFFVEKIKLLEGFSSCAYNLDGVWTVGYGHTSNVYQGMCISEVQARKFLEQDIATHEHFVNNHHYTWELNQCEFEALTSFCFSLGTLNLDELLGNNSREKVANDILLYVYVGETALDNLRARRSWEHDLFLYCNTGGGDQSNGGNSGTQIIYQVYIKDSNQWLENVNGGSDYAGYFGKSISAVYASLNTGNVYYKVHIKGGGWLPEVSNRDDFAGIYGKEIDGFMIKSTDVSIQYRVHLKNKGWLPYVTGYSESDDNNGYAGVFGKPIDGIQMSIS